MEARSVSDRSGATGIDRVFEQSHVRVHFLETTYLHEPMCWMDSVVSQAGASDEEVVEKWGLLGSDCRLRARHGMSG
jgi:hypothetical protein